MQFWVITNFHFQLLNILRRIHVAHTDLLSFWRKDPQSPVCKRNNEYTTGYTTQHNTKYSRLSLTTSSCRAFRIFFRCPKGTESSFCSSSSVMLANTAPSTSFSANCCK